MSSKAEKERQKQIQEKCQRLLNEMLKDEDNKYCVDCDAKGPRWASWNLGIFLCIRCAGMHRNLGVHISRVKSVNLDTWTPQQVVSLQQMGNSRARAVYEANLPDNFRRPQNDGTLEGFIRAKYEQKKYMAREWVPSSPPKVNWDKELDEEAEKMKKKKREVKGVTAVVPNVRPVSTPAVIPQPLPKPQSSSPKPPRNSTQYTDLLGLETPVTEKYKAPTVEDTDLFSKFMAAPQPAPVTTSTTLTRSEEEDSFFNQSVSEPRRLNQPLTKDSILALYSNPGAFGSPICNTLPQKFTTANMNGVSNVPRQQINVQNGFISGGRQFPITDSAQSISNAAIAANPFYSMAALTSQNVFSSQQKGFGNVSASQGLEGIDFQNTQQLSQQMSSLSMSTTSKPSAAQFGNLQQTNYLNDGGVKPTQQVISTANSNLWH